MIDTHKLEGENEEQYIWRLGQAKDSGEPRLFTSPSPAATTASIGMNPRIASRTRKRKGSTRRMFSRTSRAKHTLGFSATKEEGFSSNVKSCVTRSWSTTAGSENSLATS